MYAIITVIIKPKEDEAFKAFLSINPISAAITPNTRHTT